MLTAATPRPWDIHAQHPSALLEFLRTDAELAVAAVNALPSLLDRLEVAEGVLMAELQPSDGNALYRTIDLAPRIEAELDKKDAELLAAKERVREACWEKCKWAYPCMGSDVGTDCKHDESWAECLKEAIRALDLEKI